MTVAPHSSLVRRLVLTIACAVLFLVLGVLALQQYGAGVSVFLFVLAAVCAVDAGQVQRRRVRRARG